MEEFTPTGNEISYATEKTNLFKKDITRSQSLPWWDRLFKGSKANFSAPPQSNWEKETGEYWRELGKL